ncbi:xanthine dehydrogenase family protein molybdopterin-binding subunit [Pseudonocardia acaciae]|uniref:xanthine dehydrogenase family protein molybdopterin-binding subunit n=1 Tax=Pseudonocardia acaciae TaxID=551276 RepID=UPI00048F7EB2|nr:xanthine dehydrogenase family protein molybdopterin-binding subunit [Pseudonocardia acaciae]
MSTPDARQPKLFGASVKRTEDPRFLLGRARYVDDIVLPRMLHAAFVRSPLAHAEVRAVDTAAALARADVHAVLTGADLHGTARGIVCDSTMDTWQSTEFPALATDRVRFAGQTVAAVAASDRYVAEDACELVEVDYAELPVVASIPAAIADGAPRLHQSWTDNLFIKRHFEGGDVAGAFEAAHGVVTLELVNNRHSGIPLETRGCIAHYDQAEDTLVLYTATQIPHLVRTGLADALGLPENQVRVIAPDVGGGFGIKGHLFPEEIAVCLLAVRTRRPVKWIEDRVEHMIGSIHAREHHHEVRAAYTADGVVTALRARVYVDCGAYSVYPWTSTMDTGMALGILPGPYRIQNYECDAFSVATNKTPLGPYRGVARPAAAFSIERVMDAVAVEVGIDQAEVRRRNLVRPEEFPYRSVTGLLYDSGSFRESLEKLLVDSGYERLRAERRAAREQGRYLGIGISCYTEQSAHATSEFVKRGVPIIFGYDTATVRMDPSGRVTVQLSTHSHGQGHETTMAQMVADQLGLPLADIKVRFGDTAQTPYGHGTFASRSAVLAGGASEKAARQVADKLLEFAAEVLEAAPSDLELVDGAAVVKGAPWRSVGVRDLARWAYHRPEKLPRGMEPVLEAVSSYDAEPGGGTFANAAHLCVVEVDPDTGGVTLLGYHVVEDCGRMINPLIVTGQVHGGVAQGLGGALLEEFVYDEQGQPLATTFMDYLLPGATDIPHIGVTHLQTPSPFTIQGIKGMGEGGSIGPGPALAAAVDDALRPLGRCFGTELPLTPARVRALVAQARKDGS